MHSRSGLKTKKPPEENGYSFDCPPRTSPLPHTYSFVCIWGRGNRVGDPDFVLIKEEIDKERCVITFFFEGAECIIEKPSGIAREDKRLEIKDAERVIWRHYGNPGTPENPDGTVVYIRLNDSKVRVIQSGKDHNWNGIVKIRGRSAFILAE